MQLRPTPSTAGAPTTSAWRLPPHHFIVICLAVGVALHAEPFEAAAAELRLHQAVVVCVVLAVAALFHSAIASVHFFVAPPAGGHNVSVLGLGLARTATSAIISASRRPPLHLVVLCLGMSALLHVEPLVDAAAALHIHPGIVGCFVLAGTALFNWAILSINYRVARQASERVPKMMPRPAAPAASAARSPRLARSAFLVLAALMSASWFVEPFAAAAELWLPRAVTVIFISIFAALFNVSTHLVRSTFLPGLQFAGTTEALVQGVGLRAIAAGIMGVGLAVAACLVGAGGSTYFVFPPARN